MEGNVVKKEKFCLSKLRSLLVGGSVVSGQNIRREIVDFFPNTSPGHKQSVRKSVSHNQVSAGRAVRHLAARESFPSSVPDREDCRRDSHAHKGIFQRTAVPTHPTLSFSASLPAHSFQSNNDGKTAQTGGKLKLSRTGGEASARQNDNLRRKSEIWRNNLVGVKKRKEDVNLNFKRNFHFDEISLRSDLSNPEDHIYEEIDSDLFTSGDEEETNSGDNFLLGISLERRNHLKFYGSAGWDFGNHT